MIRVATLLALVASLLLAAQPAAAGSREAGSFTVDPVHSAATFRIKHLGLSLVAGRFNDLQGTAAFHPDDLKRCSVDVTIQTTSVDTAIRARDEHLRSPDFLDAARYPTMRFVSKRFLSVEGDIYRVRGALTLHGVTKPMTALVHYLGQGADGKGGWRAGAECSFWLDRGDYGMKPMLPGVANRVDVWVGLEGIRQPRP